MGMDDANSVFVCSSRHQFKLIRGAKSSSPNQTRLISKCVKCTATLMEIVGEKMNNKGDRVPFSRHYIISAGVQVELYGHVVSVTPPEANAVRHDPQA